MLTKKALIEAIRHLPDDSPIVIQGIVPVCIRIIKGKQEGLDACGNPRFVQKAKGIQAVIFEHYSEISTGEVMEVRL